MKQEPFNMAAVEDTPEYRVIKEYIEAEKKVTPHPTDHIENDLAFDSLDKVWLEGFIEFTFGTRVNAATMADFPSLAALVEHVAANKTCMEVKKIDWHELLSVTCSGLELPRSTIFLPLATRALYLWMLIYHRFEVKGRENIPGGPYILAPNHQSYVDGAAVLNGVKTKDIKHCYFYATEEHVRNPLSRFMARNSNIVVMERRYLRDSIQKLAQVLKHGRNIIIFPEGTRTRTGEVGPFKKTFAILSQELGVPVVPVCLKGAFEAWPRTCKLALPKKITVNFLPPVSPRETSTYDEIVTKVRNAIIAKLSEQ